MCYYIFLLIYLLLFWRSIKIIKFIKIFKKYELLINTKKEDKENIKSKQN